jgi:hypothetical protein
MYLYTCSLLVVFVSACDTRLSSHHRALLMDINCKQLLLILPRVLYMFFLGFLLAQLYFTVLSDINLTTCFHTYLFTLLFQKRRFISRVMKCLKGLSHEIEMSYNGYRWIAHIPISQGLIFSTSSHYHRMHSACYSRLCKT